MDTGNVAKGSSACQAATAEEAEVVDFGIDILPSGQIRFLRGDPKTNEELYQFLAQFVTNPEELREFFDAAKNITPILGEEPLCG